MPPTGAAVQLIGMMLLRLSPQTPSEIAIESDVAPTAVQVNMVLAEPGAATVPTPAGVAVQVYVMVSAASKSVALTAMLTELPTVASSALAEKPVMNGQLSRRPLMATVPVVTPPGPRHCRTTVAEAVWPATELKVV